MIFIRNIKKNQNLLTCSKIANCFFTEIVLHVCIIWNFSDVFYRGNDEWFPVTLGERDKYIGRTLYNTKTDHAGVITSTASILYKREDMDNGHSLQQDVLLSRNLCSFMCMRSPQESVRYITNTTKKHVFDQPEMKPLYHVSNHAEHCFLSILSVK